jgi:drug/metabolite transporter (DMT)-like permease
VETIGLGLSQATRTLEIGTAYAVWAGVGTGVVAVFGVLFFDESFNPLKVSGLILIIVAVVLLHLGSKEKRSASPDYISKITEQTMKNRCQFGR